MPSKIIALLAICLLMAAAYIVGQQSTATPDLFAQSAFPCHEDQVLGFSPSFGPDRVGCMNID